MTVQIKHYFTEDKQSNLIELSESKYDTGKVKSDITKLGLKVTDETDGILTVTDGYKVAKIDCREYKKQGIVKYLLKGLFNWKTLFIGSAIGLLVLRIFFPHIYIMISTKAFYGLRTLKNIAYGEYSSWMSIGNKFRSIVPAQMLPIGMGEVEPPAPYKPAKQISDYNK